jgi:amino acid transporter
MWAIGVNGFFGYVMLITYCFTLGNLDDILLTQTGYPFIQAFYNGTKSHAGASIMTAVLVVTITSSVISTLATVSRQTWSFARDKGLPFSSFISHVRVLSNL